jgi:RHS repeat-associated protein
VAGTTTYYCYADEGLIAEYSGTGDELKTYGYKPGSTWTTDPLFMKLGSQYYFYQNDHLGTPQKLISDSGAVVWSATYDDFGKATVDAGSSVTNNLRFAGQYYDEETGMHYNWNRNYEPVTGRYLSTDPLGLSAGDNLYRYALNNPIKNIDSNGKVCGTGWNEPYIPDYPNGWNFAGPCQNHDDCYGCKGKKMGMKKEDCDNRFLKELLKVCLKGDNIIFHPDLWPKDWREIQFNPYLSCPQLALMYYKAVSSFGQKAFRDGRKDCCD